MIRIDEIWLSTQPMDMRAGMDTTMAQVVRAFGYIKPHQGETVALSPEQLQALIQGLPWQRIGRQQVVTML